VGAALLAVGAWLNRDFLGEVFAFRGAARRGEKRSEPRPRNGARPRDLADMPPARPSVAPGLADSPPPRDPHALRGDREAPIVTAAEGAPRRGKAPSEDTPPEGRPRLRIR
jgi:hypothetical protein